jgi:lipopolysaccharide/colanic/teichoic acid biosynthesis glycosyltransferase
VTPHGSAQVKYADVDAGLAPIDVWTREAGRLPSIPQRDAHPGVGSERARRMLNVLVASVGIVLAAPLFVLVALLVKLSSPGPVIFRQPRVGVDRRRRGEPAPDVGCRRRQDFGGSIFTIYKFRTMKVAEATPQVWASRTDPRITRIGSFLRATRLDELPQLFNVLRGDMNIVGPRPEQPEIFRDLSVEIANYRERQSVLPGITGLAQVTLGYDSTIDDVKRKVAKDLEYIERRSVVKDLSIMARTVPVMIFQKVWM